MSSMKDAIDYANEAGFFSFNVVGWKAEFERLVEAVRADAAADHIRDAGKVMNKDEVLRLAREAGWGHLVSMPHIEALERFAALVAAHEQERCAKVCEEKKVQMNYSEAPYNQCAAAIRARGKK